LKPSAKSRECAPALPRNPKTKIADPASFRRALHAWFTRHKRDLPWRRDFSPYAVMVSEFMLQQTQVATVVPYFTRWMKQFPTFASLAEATEEEVLSVWQGLGYYSRARRLREAALAVTKQLGGDLPRDPQQIAALPGVGRYTAGAIAAFALYRPRTREDARPPGTDRLG
jgi:A/G-specific adenine glycosylase